MRRYCSSFVFLSFIIFALGLTNHVVSAQGQTELFEAATFTTNCAGGWCLQTETTKGTQLIPLPLSQQSSDGACYGRVTGGAAAGQEIRSIGDFTNDGVAEMSALYCERGTDLRGVPQYRTVLAVVDPVAARVLDVVRSPDLANQGGITSLAAQNNSYTDYPTGPDGRAYPFLAAGSGDSFSPQPVTYEAGVPQQGYLCLFDPERRISGPRCGASDGSAFAEINTVPPAIGGYAARVQNYYSEGSGWVLPKANDWDVIYLAYHSLVLALSSKSGAVVDATAFNVSDTEDFRSIQGRGDDEWFHSGRNYGTKSVHEHGSDQYIAMISGSQVGQFSDLACGPSRWLGALRIPNGAIDRQSLAWSTYLGFQSSNQLAGEWDRFGDFVNNCPHYFDTGVSEVARRPAFVYSYFQAEELVDVTSDVQVGTLAAGPWCTGAQQTFYDTGAATPYWPVCADYFATDTEGNWYTEVQDVATGETLFRHSDQYLWGMSDNLTPDGEQLYLVELTADKRNFDLREQPAGYLQVVRAAADGWSSYSEQASVFPFPGRPKITYSETRVNPEPGIGLIGKNYGLAQLMTTTDTRTGLDVVQLEDDSWVGYYDGEFAVRSPRCVLAADQAAITTPGEESVTLSWEITPAEGESVVAAALSPTVLTPTTGFFTERGWNGLATTNGSQTVIPNGYTTYELTVTGSNGLTGSCEVTINNASRAAQARDKQRRADLADLQKQLADYHGRTGVYAGPDAPVQAGWINQNGPGEAYTGQGTFSYMFYGCAANQSFALSTTLENPSATDIRDIQRSCNGTGVNGTHTVYGKNFALTAATAPSPTPDPGPPAKTLDAQRRADLQLIGEALEAYYDVHGTYIVAGAGYAGGGMGWVSSRSNFYPLPVVEALFNEGLLDVPYIDDPVTRPGYMLYVCDDGQRFALSAQLDNPSNEDLVHIKASCNGVGGNGTYEVYERNYAVTGDRGGNVIISWFNTLRDAMGASVMAAWTGLTALFSQ